ncbi:MAG: TIM barrel protein [Verrucomicrobiales bacterium]
MKCSVTVSLVPEVRSSGPFVFWEGLEDAFLKAAELGFDGIEIFPSSPESLPIEKIQELMKQRSLAVAALGTGAGWVKHKLHLTHPDASVRKAAVEFVQGIINAAAQLKSASGDIPAVIIGSMQGRVENSRPETMEWLRESLEMLGHHAEWNGAILLYEFLNRYETNIFNRVVDTVDFLGTLKTKQVKILADLFHMNIEEESVSQALLAGGSHIGHIHFVDSNRKAAGMGHTNFSPIFSALRQIQYSGYLSAEALPLPTSEAAAKQTICAFRKFTQQ